jgi:hypothetical protein
MYYDLKATYWWYGTKRDIAKYLALCDTCQQAMAEHQQPAGLLQPLQGPEWKWEEIAMDFIMGLPRTQSGYDSIWVRGSIDQGSSLYTCQDHLLWTTTSRALYVEDSLFAWSVKEDGV